MTASVDPISALAGRVRAGQLPPPRRRRAIREETGVSLREAAAVLGVDPNSVLRWERGTVVPRRDHAEAYRRLLDELEGTLG